MNSDKLKNIVEGFIFASDKAISAEQIIKLFPEGEKPTNESVLESIEALMVDFEGHGIELKKVKSGYRFQVRQETASWVSHLWDEKPAKYTRAMLETLALIVYRQPITRGEIEEVRGVSVSSNIIRTMMEREWVKVIGHRDVPGRPALYASTKEFLDYFNLGSLEELPPLSEIKDLDSIATELDPEQNAALISAIRDMQKENKEEGESDTEEAEQTTDTHTVKEAVDKNEVDENSHDLSAEQHSDESLVNTTANDGSKGKSFSDLLSNFEKNERTTDNLNEVDEDNESSSVEIKNNSVESDV